MHLNKYICLMLALVLVVGVVSTAVAQDTPLDVVKTTSDQALEQMSSREEELKASPDKIYELVEHIVLPRFDFERMSTLVLGKYWRRAKPEEKSAFTLAFREMLVRTYAMALLSYSGEEIVYLPSHDADNASRVKVNTQVAATGAAPIPISYSLHQVADDWKVFDVTIDGISLVSNYRSSFSTKIKRYKLSGLIAKLEKRNKRKR